MKRLQQIQLKLRAPKDKRNDFGKYPYRSAESILALLKPLCEETGTLVLFPEDDIIFDNGHFYAFTIAKLYDLDGNVIAQAKAKAREPETRAGCDPAQISGGSMSYAHKYALCALFAIDDSRDDPDARTALQQAIDDLMVTSTDRDSFEQAMKRHKEFMTNDDFRKACAELSKKYPKP